MNSRLIYFYNQKNIKLIRKDSLKEEHLGIKIHLNGKSNSNFTKNLNFIGGN